MKQCIHCGAQMEDNSLFCAVCGNSMKEINACPHCGEPLNSGDMFCQNCGASLNHNDSVIPAIVEHDNEQPYYKRSQASSSNTVLWAFFVVLLLTLVGAGGFLYYFLDYAPKKAKEEARIQAEKDEKDAIHQRDSLDQALWQKTIEKDDSAAYSLYLEKFPEGKHADQAQKRLDYEEKLRLTDSEEYRVSEVISYFFNNLAGGYEDGMISYLNPSLSTFLGKKNATKVDAIAYMKKIHSDDVYSVDITMGDIEVKKTLVDNEEPVYTAKFTYDQRLEREDTSLETFASMKGTATLNKNFKITSLSLSKTATY